MLNPHLDRALALLDIRPDAAAKECREALAQEPDNAYAHSLLALCLLDLKQSKAAMSEAREAVKLAPDEPFSFYILARCHFDADEFIEAEVAVEEAINLNPYYADYWWMLALIQLTCNDLKSALNSAEKGLENEPDHPNCHNLRAYILNSMGKREESDSSAQAAFALRPDDAFTHTLRGWSLVERHDYKESLHHFREALRLEPTLQWARDGLIQTLPTQHWIFKVHLRLKNAFSVVAVLLWLVANICLLSVPRDSNIGVIALIYLSWISMFMFAFVVFLPDALISGPVLKFLLQFEPDGKHILTPTERRINNHAVAFLAGGLLSLVIGIVSHNWYFMWCVLAGFAISRPLFLDAAERNFKCWAWHVAGAGLASLLMFAVCSGGEQLVWRGLRTVAIVNFLKVAVSAKLLKVIGTGIGVGVIMQGVRQRKKDEARKRMLEDG